ncbi:hypothetical protein N9B24_01130 [bacterium]|nr:hypothetical protein [bacterium]
MISGSTGRNAPGQHTVLDVPTSVLMVHPSAAVFVGPISVKRPALDH